MGDHVAVWCPICCEMFEYTCQGPHRRGVDWSATPSIAPVVAGPCIHMWGVPMHSRGCRAMHTWKKGVD
jgi:hypothetical protein